MKNKPTREVYLAAHACRAIFDCKLYGLLEGGPKINVDRCDQMIDVGAAAGFTFTTAEINAAAIALISQINQENLKHENQNAGAGNGA